MRASLHPTLGALLVALAGCGWIEAGLAPFRAPSTALTLAAGAGLVAFGLLADRMGAPAPEPVPERTGPVAGNALAGIGVAAWTAAVSYAVAVELWEYLQSPRRLHPTLSSLANVVLGPGHRPLRAAAFVAWGIGCVVLARRPRRRS